MKTTELMSEVARATTELEQAAIKIAELYAEQTLRSFMEWFKEQCWPIEPKESKGRFDSDRAIDELIDQFLAERQQDG